jgi:AraC-like DNA-binding protein
MIADRFSRHLAAGLFERSVPHLVRSFKREFGITPYAYVIGARIERARKRLLAGEPAGSVAVEVGFHDQAHLTRHFKRHVSVPPATYAASGINLTARRPTA